MTINKAQGQTLQRVGVLLDDKMNDDKEQSETQPSTGIGGVEIPTNKDINILKSLTN